MARGVNKVIIIGNLGADPEVRRSPQGGNQSGIIATSIRVATSENWKDKQSGENRERTEWHRVVFYNRLAEIAGEYLKSGSKVFIEGSLRTRKWQDQNGNDKYTTEIVANSMQMLDGKGGGGSDSDGEAPSHFGGQASSGRSRGGSHNNQPQNNNRSAPPPAMDDDFDDDIPF